MPMGAQVMPERIQPGSAVADNLPPHPPEEKPKPAPGTYVIQVPKDQIYWVPTPEIAQRSEELTRIRPRRRSCCCRFLLWVVGIFLALALALGVTAGVLYLVFRPKLPNYTVDSFSVKGLNLTSGGPLSPEFDVTVRAENPNKKIGFRYRGGSSIFVSYPGVNLCGGAWPAFYQGPRNVTVFTAALRGSGLRLSGGVRSAMAAEERRGAVTLEVKMRVPVSVRFGAVTTWTVTAKVQCDVKVDRLTQKSRVVSTSCGVKV